MECYFDNSATTCLLQEVVEEMTKDMKENYGNPSSIHRKGLAAERKLKASREIIGGSIGAKAKEIVFTSGGTEANNFAIKGISKTLGKRGKHIITSGIEHASVYQTIRELEEEGFFVTYLRPGQDGCLNWEDIHDQIKEDTFLLSLMHINNELGFINDIQKIQHEIMLRNQKRKIPLHLHIDAVQSYLKLPLNMTEMKGISTLSISSHKVHGPKGIGALYIREGTRISPLISGGGQENGLRSGTENTLGIWGFAKAVELQLPAVDKIHCHLLNLRNNFLSRLKENLADISVNSKEQGAAHICNVSFHGIPGEILLHSLEEEGIYVSTGAACSSKKKGSRVLENMGMPTKQRETALRFSFSQKNTLEEVDYAVDTITQKVKELRKILKYR